MTLLEYAQTRNATRVIVGTPKRHGWRAWLRPSTATQLIRHARGFDVTAIARPERLQAHPTAGLRGRGAFAETPTAIRWDRYGWAFVTTLACTAVAFALYPRFELSNLVMVYLLGVTVAGLRFGRGPSVMTAILNVAAFDFFGPQGDIHLTPLEYRIIECLARQAGMVVRQRQLLREVWGPDRMDDTRGLRVFIKSLRQKLEADPRRPRYLVSEAGLGYRLWTDEAPLPC